MLACLAQPALAVPEIATLNGQMVHGQTVTISGTGFGAHANYNNLSDTWQGQPFLNFRFKDFEDQQFESDGFYTGFDDSREIVTSGGHVGSYGKVTYGLAERRVEFAATNSSQHTGTFYSSFWFMVAPETQSGKLFRMYISSGSQGQHNLSLYTGCDNTQLRGSVYCEGTGFSTEHSTSQFQPGVWHRLDVLVLVSGSTLNLHTWIDGVLQWSAVPGCTTLNYYPEGRSWELTNLIDNPGLCAAHPTWDGSYNYDDIYYSYTQARVEIGNAPTYAGSTHREVQLPKTWDPGQITFTVNKGSFSGGSSQYLFVVDQDGAASPGRPVVIDGAPEVAPAPPQDLRAN